MQKKAEEKDRLQDEAPVRYDGDGGGLRVNIFYLPSTSSRLSIFLLLLVFVAVADGLIVP
jgi:hypothetical protein